MRSSVSSAEVVVEVAVELPELLTVRETVYARSGCSEYGATLNLLTSAVSDLMGTTALPLITDHTYCRFLLLFVPLQLTV